MLSREEAERVLLPWEEEDQAPSDLEAKVKTDVHQEEGGNGNIDQDRICVLFSLYIDSCTLYNSCIIRDSVIFCETLTTIPTPRGRSISSIQSSTQSLTNLSRKRGP